MKKFLKILRRVVWVLVLLVVLAVVAALGGSAYVSAVGHASTLTPEDTPPEGLDCILVLGCSVHADGTPSPMLADRLTRGVELYQAGWAPKLLLSGDNGQDDYNEVAVMKAWAMDHGVPEEDIVLDHAGFSTYDSVYRARDVFQVKRMVIVTQGYHLYRAVFLAQKLGLETVGVAADGEHYRGQLVRDIREIVARDKDLLWSILQLPPKYLGDPIPIGE